MDNNFDNTPKDDSTPVSLSICLKSRMVKDRMRILIQRRRDQMQDSSIQIRTPDVSTRIRMRDSSHTAASSISMGTRMTRVPIIIISSNIIISRIRRIARIVIIMASRMDMTSRIITSRIIIIIRTTIVIIPGIIIPTDRDRIRLRCPWVTGSLPCWRRWSHVSGLSFISSGRSARLRTLTGGISAAPN